MKFGFRVPSLKKRISARTSWKRYARHSMGIKAPKGLGIVTNPKKAIYNKIYRKTTIGIDEIGKIDDKENSVSLNDLTRSNQTTVGPLLIIFSGLISLIFNLFLGIFLLTIGGYWLYRINKK